MSDTTDDPGHRGNGIIKIPDAGHLRPLANQNLITELQALQRTNWDLVTEYMSAISGVTASVHGSRNADEYGLAFRIQAIARDDGYAALAEANVEQLRRAGRWAFKRNTGIRVGDLIAQNKRLMIEHKARAEAQDGEAAQE